MLVGCIHGILAWIGASSELLRASSELLRNLGVIYMPEVLATCSKLERSGKLFFSC